MEVVKFLYSRKFEKSFSTDIYYITGCPSGIIQNVVQKTDSLSSKVLEQVNLSQELVMINSFARETNEYQINKSMKERISEIASWTWVLEDLSNRLEEAIATLWYEHKALVVVIQRVQDELKIACQEGRPGALNPESDGVEEAIKEEIHFLRSQKKMFNEMKSELETHLNALENTKRRIMIDISKKQESLIVDESISKLHKQDSITSADIRKIKKVGASMANWEKRCAAMKRAGLQALNNAVGIRHQVRAARMNLSIAAQAVGSKVDAALRKRLHVNSSQLEELDWQKQETQRDLTALNEELMTAEQSHMQNLEHERLLVAKIADRKSKPPGEVTRDDVDKKMRDELTRLRYFSKSLIRNIERIHTLEKKLTATITQMDCYASDLQQVIRLDNERLQARFGDQNNSSTHVPPKPLPPNASRSNSGNTPPLIPIMEEDENEYDDYPFDY